MKKIICKVEYDTENAELVAKFTSGYYGDSEGYEEILFMTPSGKYFLYMNGGADSIHPAEDIKRISADKAKQWREEKAV